MEPIKRQCPDDSTPVEDSQKRRRVAARTLDSIPDELIIMIMDLLAYDSFADLRAFATTSRRYKTISETPYVTSAIRNYVVRLVNLRFVYLFPGLAPTRLAEAGTIENFHFLDYSGCISKEADEQLTDEKKKLTKVIYLTKPFLLQEKTAGFVNIERIIFDCSEGAMVSDSINFDYLLGTLKSLRVVHLKGAYLMSDVTRIMANKIMEHPESQLSHIMLESCALCDNNYAHLDECLPSVELMRFGSNPLISDRRLILKGLNSEFIGRNRIGNLSSWIHFLGCFVDAKKMRSIETLDYVDCAMVRRLRDQNGIFKLFSHCRGAPKIQDNYFPDLQRIRIHASQIYPGLLDSLSLKRELTEIQRMAPNIETLVVNWKDHDYEIPFLSPIFKLRQCYQTILAMYDPAVAESIVHQNPKIDLNGNSTSVTDEMLQSLAENIPTIESLNLRNSQDITDEGFCRLLDSCSSTYALNLSGCTGLTDRSAQKIMRTCSLLKELNLYGCTRMLDNSVSALLSQNQSMQFLNLGGLDLSATTLSSIALNSPNLKRAHVSENRNINDAFVHQLLLNSKKLRELDVSYTQINGSFIQGLPPLEHLTEIHLAHTDVTDSHIERLLEKCPRLKQLNLYGCPHITHDRHHVVSLNPLL